MGDKTSTLEVNGSPGTFPTEVRLHPKMAVFHLRMRSAAAGYNHWLHPLRPVFNPREKTRDWVRGRPHGKMERALAPASGVSFGQGGSNLVVHQPLPPPSMDLRVVPDGSSHSKLVGV